MRHVLPVSAIILCIAGGAHAQAANRPAAPTAKTPEPPLAETLTWIRDQITADTPLSDDRDDKIELVDFSSCTIRWTHHRMEIAIPGISPAYHQTEKYTVPLGDVDPPKVKVTDYQNTDGSKEFIVHLYTKGDRESITTDTNTSYYKAVRTGSATGFNFRTNDIAQRVAKAFAHAAELCGKQPF